MKIVNLLLAVILTGIIVGCDTHISKRKITRTQPVCDTTTSRERSEFILTCIKNANPNSDEEPEDWILLCEKMAERTLCSVVQVEVIQRKNCSQCYWEDQSISKVENIIISGLSLDKDSSVK